MDSLLKIPAILNKFQSMSNRAIRLIFDTKENLTDEEISKITSLHEKFLWLACFHEKAQENEILETIKTLPPLIKEKWDKSPSQRLRDRMFVYYQNKYNKTEGFNDFYEKSLNEIGQNYLNKLN